MFLDLVLDTCHTTCTSFAVNISWFAVVSPLVPIFVIQTIEGSPYEMLI